MLWAIALAGACATPEEGLPESEPIVQTPAPRAGGRIVVGTNAESDGFLPTINRWTPPTLLIARAVFDPLATLDDSGVAKPYLAESFTHNPGYTQWTIKLRPGISFHNGEPLTADALQKHFEAARASVVTRDAIASFDKMTIPDPLTFVIDLKQPWAHLPNMMTSQLGYIPAPSMYGANNEGAPSHPVGTGPFKFATWRQNDRLIVERNPNYWRKDKDGRQLPYLSQVEFQPVPDDNVRSLRLRNGELDVVQTEAYREVSGFQQMVRDDPGGRLRALLDDSQGAEQGIVLNTQSGPFVDRNLRLAAAYAIDRKALAEQMFNGFYEVANGPFTAKSKWGSAQNYPTYFPERARQLVSEWKAGGKGRTAPKITVTNIAVADSVPIAQKIVKWWTDAGFEVQLRNEEEKVGSVDLVIGRADAVMVRFWDKFDPDVLYPYLISDSIAAPGSISLNFSRYRSATVDQALKAARASDDDAVRRQQYQKVWDDFAENLPVIFMFHTRWAFGYQAKVHGIGELRLPDATRAEPVTWGNLYLTGVWVD
jgi:ABC-type transport system substrate-binding protein